MCLRLTKSWISFLKLHFKVSSTENKFQIIHLKLDSNKMRTVHTTYSTLSDGEHYQWNHFSVLFAICYKVYSFYEKWFQSYIGRNHRWKYKYIYLLIVLSENIWIELERHLKEFNCPCSFLVFLALNLTRIKLSLLHNFHYSWVYIIVNYCH